MSIICLPSLAWKYLIGRLYLIHCTQLVFVNWMNEWMKVSYKACKQWPGCLFPEYSMLLWEGSWAVEIVHGRSTTVMWRVNHINSGLWPQVPHEEASAILSVPPYPFEKKNLREVFKMNISNFPQIRKILLVWSHYCNLIHRHDSFQILSSAWLMYLFLFINTLLYIGC